MSDVKVTRTGDWAKARRILHNLPDNMKKEVKKASELSGVLLVGEIKKGIVNQAPGGQRFEPLHPLTIQRKGSSKALIDSGDLLESITYRVMDDGLSLFVGILKTAKNSEGDNLANIGWVMEKGAVIKVTTAMRKYLHGIGLSLRGSTEYIIIPPRPFIEPTVAKEVQNIRKIFRERVTKALVG